MNILDDQKIKEAFEEYENSFILQEQDDLQGWEKIQSRLLKRKAFQRNLFHTAAAICLLSVLSGWFVSFKNLSEENARLQRYNTQLQKDLEKGFVLQKKMTEPNNPPENKMKTKKLNKVIPAKSIVHFKKLSKNPERVKPEAATIINSVKLLNPPLENPSFIVEKVEIEDLSKIENQNSQFLFMDKPNPKPIPEKRTGRKIKIQFLNTQEDLNGNSDKLESVFRLHK